MKTSPLLFATPIAVLVALTARAEVPATADPGDATSRLAQARDLIEKAKSTESTDERTKLYRNATSILRRLQERISAPVTSWYLATCYDALGMTYSAFQTYTRAVELAREELTRLKQRPQPTPQSEPKTAQQLELMAKAAEKKAKELTRPWPTLEITRADPQEIELRLLHEHTQDFPIPVASESAKPLDPGTYTLIASAKGYEPTIVQITLKPGQNEKRKVSLKKLVLRPTSWLSLDFGMSLTHWVLLTSRLRDFRPLSPETLHTRDAAGRESTACKESACVYGGTDYYSWDFNNHGFHGQARYVWQQPDRRQASVGLAVTLDPPFHWGAPGSWDATIAITGRLRPNAYLGFEVEGPIFGGSGTGFLAADRPVRLKHPVQGAVYSDEAVALTTDPQFVLGLGVRAYVKVPLGERRAEPAPELWISVGFRTLFFPYLAWQTGLLIPVSLSYSFSSRIIAKESMSAAEARSAQTISDVMERTP